MSGRRVGREVGRERVAYDVMRPKALRKRDEVERKRKGFPLHKSASSFLNYTSLISLISLSLCKCDRSSGMYVCATLLFFKFGRGVKPSVKMTLTEVF